MERDAAWDELHEEGVLGVLAWRKAHPKATLAEIETESDRQLATLRARLIQDVAQASAATDVKGQAERLVCPHCGRAVRGEGQRKRRLKTTQAREVALKRDYVICPRCTVGFFPPG
jgi:ribosomal protein S27AE